MLKSANHYVSHQLDHTLWRTILIHAQQNIHFIYTHSYKLSTYMFMYTFIFSLIIIIIYIYILCTHWFNFSHMAYLVHIYNLTLKQPHMTKSFLLKWVINITRINTSYS